MNILRFSCVMLALVLLSCSPRAWQPLETGYDSLTNAKSDLDRARSAGAESCAPDAMSDAQVAFYSAAHELSEGSIHPDETSGLIATAEKRANDAYRQATHGCSDKVADVYFDFDNDKLTARATSTLDGVTAALGGKSGSRVRLSGYTDSRGSESYNFRLSQRRVNAVKHYLVSKGVDANRMQTKAYGESKPVASNDNDAGRAKNRRVEIWRSK